MNPDSPPEEWEPPGDPSPDQLQERMLGDFLSAASHDDRTELDEYWHRGWATRKDETTTPEDIQAARELFWQRSGIPRETFDWAAWRKAMHYEENEQQEDEEELDEPAGPPEHGANIDDVQSGN